MRIYLNGEAREVADGLSVEMLVETLSLTGRRIAVEVNEELIPRSQFGTQGLHADDKVELIHAVGGG